MIGLRSGRQAETLVRQCPNLVHQLGMFAEQFKQQRGGFVWLRLAALVLGKRAFSTAEDAASVGLAQVKFFAARAQDGAALLVQLDP